MDGCTIGPPTGPKEIMSLLHLDIHMLHPGQPRIQDYPEILDQQRKLHSNLFKKKVQRNQEVSFTL